MNTNCEYISYEDTGYFSKLVLDYIKADEKLQTFYKHPVSIEGIKSSIVSRKQFDTPRHILVQELQKQYAGIELNPLQKENLQSLLLENTFTICTAHQPNIFTGHLYFIYKILHTIKLAKHLKQVLPANNYVPIYYMGSEDADLDELGHINLNGEKLEWKTKQTGAVGRMKVDKDLVSLITRLADQLEVLPQGKVLISLFKEAYKEGESIQKATLFLVDALFKSFGLLIVIPDNANLKQVFKGVVERELREQFSYPLVEETIRKLGENYKAQASGRELNLFYLTDDRRDRVVKDGDRFKAEGLGLSWSEQQILAEADLHPERFSANVILRGVFQEMILPNIAFIGGGGEIAYWLELKKVFEACAVPYPVLIVRNSFLLMTKEQKELTDRLSINGRDVFKPTHEIIKALVKKESEQQLQLTGEKQEMENFYNHLKDVSSKTDLTLSDHVQSLYVKALDKVNALEKKLLRAETRKFQAQQRQITKVKEGLFPGNNLQERVDNFSVFYALYGDEWLNRLYDSALTFEQKFCIMSAG